MGGGEEAICQNSIANWAEDDVEYGCNETGDDYAC